MKFYQLSTVFLRRQKLREHFLIHSVIPELLVKIIAQGHRARVWQRMNLNPGHQTPYNLFLVITKTLYSGAPPCVCLWSWKLWMELLCLFSAGPQTIHASQKAVLRTACPPKVRISDLHSTSLFLPKSKSGGEKFLFITPHCTGKKTTVE